MNNITTSPRGAKGDAVTNPAAATAAAAALTGAANAAVTGAANAAVTQVAVTDALDGATFTGTALTTSATPTVDELQACVGSLGLAVNAAGTDLALVLAQADKSTVDIALILAQADKSTVDIAAQKVELDKLLTDVADIRTQLTALITSLEGSGLVVAN